MRDLKQEDITTILELLRAGEILETDLASDKPEELPDEFMLITSYITGRSER